MTKARTALAVAMLLAVALPLTMVAQSDAPPAAPPQGPMGEHHDHMGGPPSPQQHLDHLAQVLNLTDDQKAKIKPILEDTQAQSDNLRKDTSLTQQERFTKLRELHEKSMAQVRGFLTPEQQTKLDSMNKRHEMLRGRSMGHDHVRGPKVEGQQPPPPPPQ